jgi:CubicO group peptidase (beta-lactamase class C family)
VKQLDDLLQQGLTDKVFEQARAVVYHRGQKVYDGGNAAPAALFDLASLTKVMSTTPLFLRLGIDPQMPIGDVFYDCGVADRTVADLFYHRSGLPAFEPFFAYCKSREEAVQSAIATKPIAPVGAQAVYSDIGFIILGEMVSALRGEPLDTLFAKHIASELQLSTHFRRIDNPPPEQTVSTGGTRPREPAPGQEGLWHVTSGPSRQGDVDDDNAYVMNGVAGHAGLFGSAGDVATYGQALLDGWAKSPLGWSRDTSVDGSTRSFGFDTPSATLSSSGSRFGLHAIGHTGFTGTSLWVSFDHKLVVALLTNRVIFGRANQRIRQFRPQFHDAVVSALLTQSR